MVDAGNDEWLGERTAQSATRLRPGVRTVILGFAAIFAVCAASCVGCLVIGSSASQQGARYAEDAVAAIGHAWELEALLNRVDAESIPLFPRDKMGTFIAFVNSRLGSLQHMEPVQTTGWQTLVGTQGVVVFSDYSTDCEFQKAKANIQLTLVRRHGEWRIRGFRINSDALMR